MGVHNARFPRTAYVRRAERLSSDLTWWCISLRDLANGPDNALVDVKVRDRAEARAYVLDDAATLAQRLASVIEGVR